MLLGESWLEADQASRDLGAELFPRIVDVLGQEVSLAAEWLKATVSAASAEAEMVSDADVPPFAERETNV